MEKSKQAKLTATIIPPATVSDPVDGRKYTMTHDEGTGDLFVSIGYEYDIPQITELRDEVLAMWVTNMGQYALIGKAYISGGEFDATTAKRRNEIFRREMDTALTAIVCSDRELFSNYPWLLDSPIYVHYESVYPEFSRLVEYPAPRQYLMC
ncbi:MAG: staygreen family protein [Bacillus sp. (in: firmicutes)]